MIDIVDKKVLEPFMSKSCNHGYIGQISNEGPTTFLSMFIVEFSSLIKSAVGWERFLWQPVVHKLEAHLIYRSGTKF